MALWAVGRYLSGGSTSDNTSAAENGAETIERLCERAESSTHLEDRRDAVRALKSLSRKFRLQVGTRGMPVLLAALHNDRADVDILAYGLEALHSVLSDTIQEHEDQDAMVTIEADLGQQFTEIFIKNCSNVKLILELVDEYDAQVRVPAVKLLTVILNNRRREVQDLILQCPAGVSRCMDLLADGREYVRNLGILLLAELTRGNATIQKIAAFENAFERLLDVIHSEGFSDGGVIVEDCLHVLLHLLVNNLPNQTLFKEGSFVQRLSPGFSLTSEDIDSPRGWSAQKVTNMHLMLQLLRCLTSPSNQVQALRSCQAVMRNCGLLQTLCSVLMASGVPAEVLTETINTVAELIRGETASQQFFKTVMAPATPPKPAIVVLLMSMVNEKQPFSLRCAVLYCFHCFLNRYAAGQAEIVATLLPTTAESNGLSAGQLLCTGLFSTESLSNWFAASALLHTMLDNNAQREQLLRVQLATSIGNPPVSLLQQCVNLLRDDAVQFQTSVALMQLLIVWMVQCPLAVKSFLSNNTNLSHVISECCALDNDEHDVILHGLYTCLLGVCILYNKGDIKSADKASLIQVVHKRIGEESFVTRLAALTHTEAYTRAMKRPAPLYKAPGDVIFDYEFTRIMRSIEPDVTRAVDHADQQREEQNRAQHFTEHESVVGQYKDLINQQDAELREARIRLVDQEEKLLLHNSEIMELRDTVQQLRDQNALLRAAGGAGGVGGGASFSISMPNLVDVVTTSDSTLSTQLKAELQQLRSSLEQRTAEIEHLKSELQTMRSVTAGGQQQQQMENELNALINDRDALKIEHEDLLVLLADQDARIRNMRKRLVDLGQAVTDSEDENEDKLDDVNSNHSSSEIDSYDSHDDAVA